MGYLIGGNKEDAPLEIKEQGDSGLGHLSDKELLTLHQKVSNDVSKYSNFQMVRKIQLNSLYGAIGNQYFRHYKLDNAEAITLTGQVAIRWIERKLNEFMNKALSTEDTDYVIASDTDSIYLNCGGLVHAVFGDSISDATRVITVLNQFCEDKIVPFIDQSYGELSEYLNCYEETLVMKRECIAERGIWTAKKRYILNVWDNEGVRYEEPKLKMMGIEAVKSSTPAPCRKYIENSLKILMNGTEDELIDYIEKTKKEFKSLPVDEIAFPRTANNLGKFADSGTIYRKSTPMHVRGSLLFNFLLKQKKIVHKFNPIGDGEKIKFVYLKTPNSISENVISFITELPDDLGLKEFVDYDTMFDKAYLDPLRVILDVIGWSTEKKTTLDDFFS